MDCRTAWGPSPVHPIVYTVHERALYFQSQRFFSNFWTKKDTILNLIHPYETEPLQLMYEIDQKISTVMKESGIEAKEGDEGASGIKPTLLDATYAWMNGASFKEICQGEVYEVLFCVFYICVLLKKKKEKKQPSSRSTCLGDCGQEKKHNKTTNW